MSNGCHFVVAPLSSVWKVSAWDNAYQYGAPVTLELTEDFEKAAATAEKAVADIYTMAEVVTDRYWGDGVLERAVHYRVTAAAADSDWGRPVEVVR